MDLQQLFTLYGKPVIELCNACSGKGCEKCNGYGYRAHTQDGSIDYIYKYPLFIDFGQRRRVELRKNILFIILTLLFIFSLVLSYFINFVHNA